MDIFYLLGREIRNKPNLELTKLLNMENEPSNREVPVAGIETGHVNYNSLSTWILSWKIRRHRTSELITRADTATLPVS